MLFAEMVNEELQIQNSKERLYLMLNDDSYYLVFLTDEQYAVIAENIPLDKRPLPPDEWDKKNDDGSNHGSELHVADLINSTAKGGLKGSSSSSGAWRSLFGLLKR